jgi:hypothetical protein
LSIANIISLISSTDDPGNTNDASLGKYGLSAMRDIAEDISES